MGIAAGTVLSAAAAHADTAAGCNLVFGASYIDDGVVLDGLNDAAAVAVYDTHVYVVSPIDDSLLALTRQGDNSLAFADLQEDSEFPVDGLDNPAGVVVSGDGEFVYVASGGADKAVSAFSVDSSNLLGYLGIVNDDDGLAGASGIAIAPDGKNIYATGATSDAVVSMARNTSTGVLTFQHRVDDTTERGLDGASAIVVSPDNLHVYVTGEIDNAINQFSRHASTGQLTYVEQQQQGVNMADGLAAPVALAISPDGEFVYTAASGQGEIGKFNRNSTTGELDFAALAATGLSGLSSIAISSDGTQLYATMGTSTTGTVRVYNRNTTTGDLTLDTTASDVSTSDAIKMREATGVAVTADGGHVYVTSKKDNSVTAFLGFAAMGTTCESGNLCTADTCDGAGTCVTGSCSLGQNCVAPGCTAGLCDNTGGPCVCKKIP